MPAPFDLSSSVGYWQWAGAGKHGLHRISRGEVQPGDIVVMGKNGNPDDGYGPDGHVGIVWKVSGGVITCIESRGHVGVCFKDRPATDWDGFIRVAGMAPQILAAMGNWETMYDALHGTVMRVSYYAGGGDNDHDGNPDRADLNDGNGIDCSGATKVCMDYGFDHAQTDKPGPPPDPTYYSVSEDDMDNFMPILWAGDQSLHHFWIEKSGHLGHRWETAKGWAKETVHVGPFEYPQKPHAYVAPNGTLVVSALGQDGTANFFASINGHWQQQVADV